MNHITPADKSCVVEILTQSLLHNKSVNYVVKQGDGHKARIAALMQYSFNLCHRFGKIYLSENRNATALVLYPHHKKTTPQAIWWDIQLIAQSIGIAHVAKVLKRESRIKKHHPPAPFAYLWFLGVDPAYQHQGLGTSLLHKIVEDARQQHLPVYLETSTERNVPWYQKAGFETYHQLDFDFPLHLMRYNL